MNIAVVGLGELGASVARSLATAGARVTVFERATPAAGTTGTSFAWVNSHQKNPLSYHELNVAGIAEHYALLDDAPARQCFFPSGNLEWAADEAGTKRLREATDMLRDRGYPVRWITADRARLLVPDLRVPGDVEIAYYPQEGYVLPVPLLARLWGEARDHGAELRCPVEILDIEERPGSVRLGLSTGDTADFDRVVLATGRWTERTAAMAGLAIPVADPDAPGSATVGFLGYTTPVPARVPAVLTTPRLNVRPDGGGRLVIQGLDLDAGADPAIEPPADGPVAGELCSRLTDLVDGAAGARLTSLRVGQRAMPADGLTVAGSAGDRVYALCTHSGITLGPLLGRLATREILTGEPSPLLDDFRPGRFAGVAKTDLRPLTPARFAGQQ
ncbi:NAD(P)/FAD-dependent oxidoreductase [Amycolatopsis nigrescens]|uniref:NAD(P)/FAD-dependent oxidoreductase n=1 Tax=Amycolatopsis nigrescens TaxID=381445 RepID=UPI00035F5F4B|nr:FAD-binding oxidoreductase [Amycolatopsis nigrescens]